MNIKIVCNKKIHKIAQSQQTYELIRTAIQKIYQDKLQSDFKLFFSPDPQNDDLYEIKNEQEFTEAKEHYAKQNWNSLKLLVQENSKEDIDKKDLELLNQSFVASRLGTLQQQEKKEQQFDIKDMQSQTQFLETEKKSVQTEKLQTQDAASMSQPQQSDQCQQFMPVSQSQSCQFAIPTQDNGQNPQNQEIDPKIYSVLNDLVKSDVDLKKLVEAINILIDNRLQYHQLIQMQKKEQKQEEEQEEKKEQENLYKDKPPSIHVRSVARILYELKQNDEFQWHVIVKNKGPHAWPQNVGIECISGPYLGQQQLVNKQFLIDFDQLGKSLDAEQEHKFELTFKTNLDFGIYDADFRLFYFMDGLKRYFGQKINFKLTVQKNKEENKNQIQCSAACKEYFKQQIYIVPPVIKSSNILEKAKELKTIFPEASIKELVEFINIAGSNTQIDELVEIYLQNKA